MKKTKKKIIEPLFFYSYSGNFNDININDDNIKSALSNYIPIKRKVCIRSEYERVELLRKTFKDNEKVLKVLKGYYRVSNKMENIIGIGNYQNKLPLAILLGCYTDYTSFKKDFPVFESFIYHIIGRSVNDIRQFYTIFYSLDDDIRVDIDERIVNDFIEILARAMNDKFFDYQIRKILDEVKFVNNGNEFERRFRDIVFSKGYDRIMKIYTEKEI